MMQSFERRLAAGEVDIHHHHAEFVDPEQDQAEQSHAHEHSHDHDHDHSHSHGVYKHIAHPLGPRTMSGENLCCCFMSQFPASVLAQESQKIERSNKHIHD